MTPLQARALHYLREQIEATGSAPSYRQISAALGLGGPSHSYRLVQALIAAGYLVRTRDSVRSVRLAGADLRAVRTCDLEAELARRGRS